MAVNKEIWLADIMENFVTDTSWLAELKNFDAFVENNKLHVPASGAWPKVLKNPEFPLTIRKRTDTDNEHSLDTFVTEPDGVSNAEKIETSYNKMQSVISGHKDALREQISAEAARTIAPAAHAKNTPLLATSGEAEDGHNKITLKDILSLRQAMNEAKVPIHNRVLILSPNHEKDLMSEDMSLFKNILDRDKSKLWGFKVYTYSDMPHYKYDTAAKLEAGGNVTNSHFMASIAFQKNEVSRALGTFDMFLDEKSPTYQADIVSFQARAIIKSVRGRGVAAIYTKKAA